MYQFNIVHSLGDLCSFYHSNLKDSCLPSCLEDLCGGWTTETYRQILIRLTGNAMLHTPLVFHHHLELSVLSNKSATLAEVFKLFDTRALSRIDATELLSVLSLICSGPLLKKIENCFFMIGLKEECSITKEEFSFFLDSLVRGITKVALLHSDTFYPKEPNQRLSHVEINLITDSVFSHRVRAITPNEFCKWLESEKGSMMAFFNTFSERFQNCQEVYREEMVNRLKIIPFIKNLLYNSIIKNIEINL